jgi:cytochrome P450
MTDAVERCPIDHSDRQNLVTAGSTAPLPPGPRGIPGLGVTPFLARDLYGYLPGLARTYGDVVRVPIPGLTVISISHPDHVKHVMTQHLDAYPKADQIKGVFGDDPPTHAMLEGDAWKRVRRLLNPMFNNTSLTAVQDFVADGVDDVLDQWDMFAHAGSEIDLQREFHLLTMAVFLRAKFDFRADRSLVTDLVTWYHEFGAAQTWNALLWSVPQWVPRPKARRGRVAHDRIMEFIERLIAQRRADPVDAHD